MKLSFILILIVTMISCKAQTNKDTEFSPIVQKAKETSLYTDQVNWQEVNQKYVQLTNGAKTIDEKKKGYEYLLNSLKDKHARILNAQDYSTEAYYTGEQLNPDTRQFNQEFMQTVINNPDLKFSYKILDDVGILKIVTIGPGGNVKEQSDEIRNGVIELKKQNIDKWIVDLRYNGGGNIEPMMSGLAPLIGEGKVGGSVNLEGEPLRDYTIKDAQFYNWGRLTCEMKNEPSITKDEKVAVLLSRYTISSGEMLAISFKGRPNTRFFGEKSGGLTTGNGFDLINDEVYLVISQDIFSDRINVAYMDKVGVDEFMAFDHTWTLDNDKQIKKAIEWLKE